MKTKTSINNKLHLEESLKKQEDTQFNKFNTTSLPDFDGESAFKFQTNKQLNKTNTLTDYKYKVS